MTAHAPHPHLRRRWLFIVVMALVFAQALGAVHRVVHAHRAHAQASAAAPERAATAAHAANETTSPAWPGSLFAGHDSEAACDLYDQMSHVDLIAGAPAVLTEPLAPSLDVAPFHAGWRLAAQAAGFLARGPPAHA